MIGTLINIKIYFCESANYNCKFGKVSLCISVSYIGTQVTTYIISYLLLDVIDL